MVAHDRIFTQCRLDGDKSFSFGHYIIQFSIQQISGRNQNVRISLPYSINKSLEALSPDN